MSILDQLDDEQPAKKPAPASRKKDEFDAVLDMEKAKWSAPEQKLDDLFPKIDNLARIGVAEAYPRKSVNGEDNFMTHRRNRITEVLIATGNQEYVESIKSILKIFDDHTAAEHERDILRHKLATYGAEAGDLIGWIACCEFLVGSNRREGLLQIQLDKVFYAKQEEALKKTVEFQSSIDAGVDAKTGAVKKMAPSSMLISSEMVKGWIMNNVPEYAELRKDIAALGTISETLKRILYQLNGSAETMQNLLRTYP